LNLNQQAIMHVCRRAPDCSQTSQPLLHIHYIAHGADYSGYEEDIAISQLAASITPSVAGFGADG